jgi:ArsR family transcriptional regulator
LSELIGFLMNDCCGGHPEICTPALSHAACAPAARRRRAHA